MSAPHAARLALAFPEPPAGRTLILNAPAELPPGPLDPAATEAVQTDAAAHAALAAAGWRVATEPGDGPFDQAVVVLPRARAAAHAAIAAAAERLAPGGALWLDGQKTDGVEAAIRELAALAPEAGRIAKAHGKLARFAPPAGRWWPADWEARDTEVAPGFVTRPGLFSADGPDPGSALLAAHLPARLPTRLVELGAGWGWLAAQLLARPGVELLHLVEADAAALACARRNVIDPRARFHWADATAFTLPEPVNGVVMNPPFHAARNADPGLGRAFIRAAAGLLTQAGRLWLVANRQLPYEAELAQHFRSVEAFGGDARYKLLTATGARRRG